MTHKYVVVVQETHTYQVTVDAADGVGAMQAARKARAKGKGRKTSREPWTAMPSVTRLPAEGTHTAVIGPVRGGKTPGGEYWPTLPDGPGTERVTLPPFGPDMAGGCPLVGSCPKPCPNEARCGEVAAFKRAERAHGVESECVSPHTAPGRYVCSSPKCAYGFELHADGTWVGPYYPDERPSPLQPLKWEDLVFNWADCAGRLQRV